MASRQHEGAQGLEVPVEFVDLGFEALALPRENAQGFVAQVLARFGHAQIGAKIE